MYIKIKPLNIYKRGELMAAQIQKMRMENGTCLPQHLRNSPMRRVLFHQCPSYIFCLFLDGESFPIGSVTAAV